MSAPGGATTGRPEGASAGAEGDGSLTSFGGLFYAITGVGGYLKVPIDLMWTFGGSQAGEGEGPGFRAGRRSRATPAWAFLPVSDSERGIRREESDGGRFLEHLESEHGLRAAPRLAERHFAEEIRSLGIFRMWWARHPLARGSRVRLGRLPHPWGEEESSSPEARESLAKESLAKEKGGLREGVVTDIRGKTPQGRAGNRRLGQAGRGQVVIEAAAHRPASDVEDAYGGRATTRYVVPKKKVFRFVAPPLP